MSDLYSASDFVILNQSVTSSGVTVSYTKPVRRWFVHNVRGGSNVVYFKRRSTDSNYLTIYPRMSFPNEVVLLSDTPTLGYFYTDTGVTVTIEIVVYL
jgi:hypothetical protein